MYMMVDQMKITLAEIFNLVSIIAVGELASASAVGVASAASDAGSMAATFCANVLCVANTSSVASAMEFRLVRMDVFFRISILLPLEPRRRVPLPGSRAF